MPYILQGLDADFNMDNRTTNVTTRTTTRTTATSTFTGSHIKRRILLVNILIIAIMLLVITIQQVYVEKEALLMLTVFPEIVIAGFLVYSVLKIRRTIEGIKGDDFYANEKLVFWHCFLFCSYCALWIVYECFIIAAHKLTDDDKGTTYWYKIKAMNAIMDILAMFLSLAIGFLILFMFLRFSKKQHKEKFDEKFLLVFNSNEEDLGQVQEAYKEKLMFQDAERLQNNRKDAAQRILDEAIVQVFMTCVRNDGNDF